MDYLKVVIKDSSKTKSVNETVKKMFNPFPNTQRND